MYHFTTILKYVGQHCIQRLGKAGGMGDSPTQPSNPPLHDPRKGRIVHIQNTKWDQPLCLYKMHNNETENN